MNDKSRMKGDFHVRFREKFEVKFLLLTRLRGRRLVTASYSILTFFLLHYKTVEIGLAAQDGGFEILYFKPPFSF